MKGDLHYVLGARACLNMWWLLVLLLKSMLLSLPWTVDASLLVYNKTLGLIISISPVTISVTMPF
jgi:hypothetical protein